MVVSKFTAGDLFLCNIFAMRIKDALGVLAASINRSIPQQNVAYRNTFLPAGVIFASNPNMKAIIIILSLLVGCYTAEAQQREQAAESPTTDSLAMSILAEYEGLMPIGLFREGASRHIPLRLRMGISGMLPSDIEPHLWEQGAMQPTIVVTPPKFLDYNSVTLRLGDHSGASLTISNGSAFNHMPWPNYPGAYRDARTLSFPLPR